MKCKGGIWGAGYTFEEKYVKKLIGYDWRRDDRPVKFFCGIKGDCASCDSMGGGVKVLNEKTGSDDNFQNDRLGPELVRINVGNLSDKL